MNYHKPPVTLLEDYVFDSEVSDEEIFENKTKIEDTLRNFGIPIQRIKATVGSTVTLYEIVQAQGVKISKIQGLENDIAQSLKALGIRIIAPIPGKGTIGIEVPNRDKQVVSMYSAVAFVAFSESAPSSWSIGRMIQKRESRVRPGQRCRTSAAAGATGWRVSPWVERHHHPAALPQAPRAAWVRDDRPQDGRVLVEARSSATSSPRWSPRTMPSSPTPRRRSTRSIRSARRWTAAWNSCCAGARNIAEYNEKFTARRLSPLNGHRYLPYIVVVVDEFRPTATAREVEGPVMRSRSGACRRKST